MENMDTECDVTRVDLISLLLTAATPATKPAKQPALTGRFFEKREGAFKAKGLKFFI